MSNLDLKKEWKKWNPEKIFLNNSKKNYDFFRDIEILKETDFSTLKKNKLTNEFKQLDKIKKKSFNNELDYLKLKNNLEEKENEYTLLNHKLRDLCSNFESAISLFEETLFSRLLKTVLIVASYIVGEKFLINESILLKKIKKIIKSDNFFLKKPQLVIHPNNKKILEKLLKQSKNNKWELICNKTIDPNSFKIHSEQSDIDATIYARWKEVYRIILEEEGH
ncbi:flagellar assembly protein FliH [Buchnera aphidicola (Aphis craccivora)]|uniref:Flagellar assembly protein FliH n=1 Tax=Buchnera aphidicola (Aphis craccivora) TaxID=466616 RepID=A0A4D6XR63_9GAMM|nr:FliH/SctL family protein [Buchnera aphidicola]QCI16341.1 flagellar assembly protein FliH [Buchnera aphidicola (Aphis craccivora)]QLL40484.1 flagellar assembly protein FliH [Buchnera aphidicola (Aphis craccivore)]WAI17855.1 MAG: FliH/SctL family protein [Buchnera aphidicola (Aphis craccivora)]